MKLLFYSLVLILTPGLISAQINFNVLEPPSVAGYYDFTWGDDQGISSGLGVVQILIFLEHLSKTR